MKTFIRKSATITVIAIAFIASAFRTEAQVNKWVYEKASNPSIGITVENAVGADYIIKDAAGNTVLQGKVKSKKTFYISTSKLANGAYRFYIGNMVVQEFAIK